MKYYRTEDDALDLTSKILTEKPLEDCLFQRVRFFVGARHDATRDVELVDGALPATRESFGMWHCGHAACPACPVKYRAEFVLEDLAGEDGAEPIYRLSKWLT